MTTKLRNALIGALALMPLAACVDNDHDNDRHKGNDALRTGSAAAEDGCVAAVNRNFGRSVAKVRSSEFSQANTVVMLSAEGETWRCLVSDDGDVDDLSVVD